MSVARHLNIDIDEYDERIRTFVPGYERLVSVAARAMELTPSQEPTILDLGIGTGALSAACLAVRPGARIVGVDADPTMLKAARTRLGSGDGVELLEGDFLDIPLPPCDAIVACVALHHVRTPEAKQGLYRRCHQALRPGGILVSSDNFTASDPRLQTRDRGDWLAHLARSYTPEEAAAHLDSWADEDVYFPLAEELEWLEAAGFSTDVLWREGGFAAIAGFRGASA